MSAPDERLDGDAMDPRIARVLIFQRERIAQATEQAICELRALGVDDDHPAMRSACPSLSRRTRRS